MLNCLVLYRDILVVYREILRNWSKSCVTQNREI